MSPSRRNDKSDEKPDPSAPSVIADDDDADDPRTFEHEAARAVREGELSAAQLPGGHGNVDPTNPDAQYPPGVVDNRATTGDVNADAAAFVPERRVTRTDVASIDLRTTDANPDYGTN